MGEQVQLIFTYYFTANLLALIAFLLGLNSFSRGPHTRRLLPLFLLVTGRAVALILALFAGGQPDHGMVAALDVFSTFCLIWALLDPAHPLSPFWNRIKWFAAALGLLLSLLPLAAGWPAPPALHSVIIAVFGTPLILAGMNGQIRWFHLAAPLILSLGYLFNLLELTNLSWLTVLLGYGVFVAALYSDVLQLHYQRQARAEARTRAARDESEERQRLLDVSAIISAFPGIEGALEHLARSMAHITGSDQAAIFTLEVDNPDEFRVATVYSPERPVELTGRYDETIRLDEYPALAAILEQPERYNSADIQIQGQLANLFALWYEDRIGPVFVQPLTVHGQPVGALLLANPVTGHAISEKNQMLCRSLSAQMAALLESCRQYTHQKTLTPPPAWNVEAQPAPVAQAEAAPPAPVEVAAPAPLTGPNPAARVAAPQPAASPVSIDEMTDFDSTAVSDYLAIIELVHEGLVVSDATGRVRLVNRAAEQILGRSRRELLGQPLNSLYGEIASDDSLESLVTAFSRRDEPLPTFAQFDNKFIQGRLIPWRNEAREWMGIVATFQDVTSRERADRARHNFIAALSRELRAPLTTIKGYSELILRDGQTGYTQDQLRILKIMNSSADRMTAVLDNAIQLGTQNKNRMIPHLETVDVMQTIREVIEETQPLADLHELILRNEVSAELPNITADRDHLHRILSNLLENACLYTPPGGYVSVRAWVQHERAHNTLRPELILMVTDNGVGIPRTEVRKIFEPFYQLPNVVNSGGMGMGLAVVKELVELHGGRVWVESVEKEGSIFQVM
ncbi:MAG: PAS domain-containing protein, partial [Chloroflexi bacterium]